MQMKRKIDIKEVIIELFDGRLTDDKESKMIKKLADLENKFVGKLSQEEKVEYEKLEVLKNDIQVLTEEKLVEFCLNFFKSIFK